MNKVELRQSFVDLGWEVQPVANWTKVSEVGGKVKYDANAASPDDNFGTAQVVVVNDRVTGESATAAGFWATAPTVTTFADAAHTYTSGIEGGSIFAVSVTDTNEDDEVAKATAYMIDGSVDNYVLKRRAGTFSFMLLV